jgi:integrase
MPRVYRKTYTRPIPTDAVPVTVKHKGKDVPAVRFRAEDGKLITAPVTTKGKDAGKRCRVPSPTWYGTVNGEPVSLCTNKAAAEVMLAELISKAEMRHASPAFAYKEEAARPLAHHLADWEASLRASGATEKHARQTVACVRRLIAGCGFASLSDVSASKVEGYLAGLRGERKVADLEAGKVAFTREELADLLGIGKQAVTDLIRRHGLPGTGNGKARKYPRETAQRLVDLKRRGRSVKTSNLYLDGVRTFVRWLVDERRLPEHPLTRLSGGNVKLDRRHDRRGLTAEQLQAIVAAARNSTRTYLGLSGEDRAMLYATACGTGFRADELASLRPEAFELGAPVPAVHLRPEDSKNGKGAVQPLPAALVPFLRDYLAGKPGGKAVWPGAWHKKAAEVLRHDLDAAGIPYVAPGPDGTPLYADFHSLRHSFIALLDQSGATLKEAMQLARHSDPKLTMAVYGRAQLNDLAGTVNNLPAVLPAGKMVTPVPTGKTGEIRGPLHDGACCYLAAAPDGEGVSAGEDGGSGPESPPASNCHNPLTDRRLMEKEAG